jgi:hypothetical protein
LLISKAFNSDWFLYKYFTNPYMPHVLSLFKNYN